MTLNRRKKSVKNTRKKIRSNLKKRRYQRRRMKRKGRATLVRGTEVTLLYENNDFKIEKHTYLERNPGQSSVRTHKIVITNKRNDGNDISECEITF
tara:strand:- start:735 stop:1022 length:288 start_codon:yes stop_codon:yes gene_type:complete